MSQLYDLSPPDLDRWIFVKKRGAIAHTGAVYRSPNGDLYLRTGEASAIRNEAEFAQMAWREGFPVPEVTDIGVLPDGAGYFIEASAGKEDFGALLGREYAARTVSDTLFDDYCAVTLRFFAAQLNPSCRQAGPSQLRDGIQLGNVLAENPEIEAGLLERAVAKAENRMRELPLVLTHGDLTPFNVMPGGIIDFEERFVAPAGYDAVTCVTFQRFWDHPQPDGTGSMRSYDFSSQQIARFLSRIDAECKAAGFPALSGFFDDFLTLKSIWALCYERPEDLESAQAWRWKWRKRVATYCAECYLANRSIESESFRAVGLG